MRQFPHITDYMNTLFREEKARWDYRLVRPVLLILYFLIRCLAFPVKFLFHRKPYGFEARVIDWVMCFGLKYLATPEAAEIMVRHVQIEPLLYRFLLRYADDPQAVKTEPRQFNGIDGDFQIGSLAEMIRGNLTVGHDELSYEVVERFDKDAFLSNLDRLRQEKPEDHSLLQKAALEENRRHSYRLLGCTNIVMLVVFTITIVADFTTAVKALNSFDSDSVLLWCLKHLYANDQKILTDLDFYMVESQHRGHYYSSAFFSNPSQYLYYHVCFDEYAYHILTQVPPTRDCDVA